jgi:citrate lyase alpha subunit
MVNLKSVRRPLSGAMAVEIWPIENLIPYPRNPRQIPQIAVDKVAQSIEEFGFRQPIVVDTKRVVIVGHVRLLAAQKLDPSRSVQFQRLGQTGAGDRRQAVPAKPQGPLCRRRAQFIR